jgi:hypothetical protein
VDNESLERIFLGFLIAFAVATVLSVVLNSITVDRIRNRHASLWKSLGGTTRESARRLEVFVRLLKLCYGPSLFRLHDRALILMALTRNCLEVASIVIFIWLIWLGLSLGNGVVHLH